MLLMIKLVYGSLFAKTAQVKKKTDGNVKLCVETFQVKISNGPRHKCILANLCSQL